MAAYQSAKFSNDLKDYHNTSKKIVTNHLLGVSNKRLARNHNDRKRLETHIGAGFTSSFDKEVKNEPSHVHS